MSRNDQLAGSANTPSPDAPQMVGERLASGIRIAFSLIIMAFLIGYLAHTVKLARPAFYWVGLVSLLWALLSVCYLVLIRRRYRPWMSYISMFADITTVTGILVIIMLSLPLQFSQGPAPMLFFAVIGLAALRRSRKLVIIAGIASSFVFLTVSLTSTFIHIPTGQLLAEDGGLLMQISVVDQMVKALAMSITAAIIGHVTGDLRRSERQYKDLFEHIPDGIVIVSPDQRIVTANQRFAELVGSEPQALINRKVTELFTGSPLGQSTPPSGIMGSPTALVRADGVEVPVRTVAASVDFQGMSCVEMSVRNVGEQVQLERQLAQSQKMETIGRLAGGLARDVNANLSGVSQAVSQAERFAARIADPQIQERLTRQLKMVADCGDGAREVVSRLLGFSERGILTTTALDLAQIVRDAADICRNTFGESYSIRVETPPETATIDGDGTSLTQVLLNLCINARDAMPDGGSITLRLFEGNPENESLHLMRESTPGTHWCVETVDTGAGMDAVTINRIFDPFYTTKPPGKGTGLGLSMVYNVVRQHRGLIDVSSQLGAGSSFRVAFKKQPLRRDEGN